MTEFTKIRYSTKCFYIYVIFNLITLVVQAKPNYKVFVIERVVPVDMNYLALKYHPVGVGVHDLETEFWEPLLEDFRKWNTYPRVEYGPGAIKGDIVEQPPIGNMFKVLLEIKKKKEEMNKDLNEGKEFL